MVVALLALALAGCSSNPATESTSAPATESTSAPATESTSAPATESTATPVGAGLTPPAEGEVESVTWALPRGEPATLDPLGTVTYSSNTVVSNLCESMFRVTPDFSTVPSLATGVEQPDDKTLIFTLRSGVTFWNGNPLTAEDVAFSLKRNADPANGSGWITLYQSVDTIEATGPLEVTVTLSKPDVAFLSAMSVGGGYVSEKAFVEQAGEAYGSPSVGVMCTGPYMFSDWESGSSITLTKNPNYWDTSVKPKVESATFTFVDDEGTLLSALKAGEVDGSYGVSPQLLTDLESGEVGKAYGGPSLQNLLLALVAQPDSPLEDVRIRQAWRMSLDFDGIVNGVYRGYANQARAVVPPDTWGYSRPVFQTGYDELPPATTDLEAAKALVAEAGTPARPIVLATLAGINEQIALAAQASAKSVGIPVEVRRMSSGQYGALFTDAAGRAGIDAIVTNGFSDYPDPLEYYSFYRPGEYYNFFEYDNPEYNALINEATATFDDDARAELVVKAQAIIMNDLPTIPVAFQENTLFMNGRISGAPLSFAFMFAPWLPYIGGT
jgi:peptide/nickel transport system substrate-binding protein